MLNVNDISAALIDLDNAKLDASEAEDDRNIAWTRYLRARERADDARIRLADAEREVVRAAGQLAAGSRPNRDTRRAQVLAGLTDAELEEVADSRYADLGDDDADLPY